MWQHSHLGRSWGCPAVDHAYASKIVEELKHGSLLNAWAE
ncbi:murein L,D-transpeptidase catalytic domain-containing protein [Rhizobium leguminosarum]